MGRREARGVEQRIHLDTRVYLQRRLANPPPSGVAYEREVWAAVETGTSELAIGAQNTTLLFSGAVTIRWDPLWESLDSGAVRLFTVPESEREGALDDSQIIGNIRVVGRRRFLRLEVEA